MRKLLVIGIGAGDPEHLTVQAVKALNRVDAFFVLDKGEEKSALTALRRAICERYIEGRDWRFVTVPDPPRDRDPADYRAEVSDWHARRAALLAPLIARELPEDGTGGILVWGDPSLYDSTLRVVDRIVADGTVPLEVEVIPGITSVQALAAAHRIALNQVGGAVLITTGRRLAAGGMPAEADDVVAMLDGPGAFRTVPEEDLTIYWGAYLGTPQEMLLAGPLAEVKDRIAALREQARARHGWIMDTYLLRRRGGE
ncbi:MAG: precorrin-6A synthase (deacetylating) [Proteobacteria bacterium]|nr:precorrin-6A synthase (deacetylating) [Pseudomonadota bacterium]